MKPCVIYTYLKFTKMLDFYQRICYDVKVYYITYIVSMYIKYITVPLYERIVLYQEGSG